MFHELDEAARACPWCARERPVIGEERSEEVEIIPAKVVVKVHVRRKYGPCTCDDFIGHDEPAIVSAPAPAKIAKGSQYANSTAAFIIVSKYVDGLPLYRQEGALQRLGLELGRGTMARMILRVSEELEPLWRRMKEDLRSSPVLGMDETVTQVLHEPERPATSQSRMWVARGFKEGPGSTDPPRPIIWFEYADSRSGDVAASIIGNFSGYLQTDGYSGYSRIGRRPEIIHVGCWAHIRREFYRLVSEQGPTCTAAEMVRLIRRLYQIEKDLRARLAAGELSREVFVEERKAATAPVFEEIRSWLNHWETKVPPHSPLGSAIAYALGQYRRAIRYVDHWLLTPDNNPVENAIRPFVIGRKNWLFHDSVHGAKASGRLYSLIETAKANGHEPYRYLCHLFTEYARASDKSAALDTLLPYTLAPAPINQPQRSHGSGYFSENEIVLWNSIFNSGF
ncbi:IS66 family transposase [Treponema sp. J25]|uniref:IS66 family transposase n=1 Tax=Treponema sp. J25 TaxID=2094121 RepID=UPI0010E281D4|nr:IS66 family transposase [Treponema sp. J25]TCW62490.1 IS66 family transposase [Treponema sp. J25]